MLIALLLFAAIETKTVQCGLSWVDPPLCTKEIPRLQKLGWRVQKYEEKSGIDSTWRLYTLTRPQTKKRWR